MFGFIRSIADSLSWLATSVEVRFPDDVRKAFAECIQKIEEALPIDDYNQHSSQDIRSLVVSSENVSLNDYKNHPLPGYESSETS